MEAGAFGLTKKGTRTSEGRWKKGEKNRYIHRDSAEMQSQSVGWDSESAIQLGQHSGTSLIRNVF